MNKKLPKMFVNKIDKKLDNNNSYFVSNGNFLEKKESVDVNKKIKEIFDSLNYVYKMDVIIELKDKTIKKRVIGRNKDSLITIENESIPISEIIDINYDN